jgi:hypothetical protein
LSFRASAFILHGSRSATSLCGSRRSICQHDQYTDKREVSILQPDRHSSFQEARPSETLVSTAQHPLIWKRVGLGFPQFEFRQGGQVLGGMQKSPRNGFSATGDFLGKEWEIRLESPFFRKIKIGLENPDRDQVGCRFEGLSVRSGRILLPGDSELRWRNPFLRNYDHIIEIKGGPRLIRIRPSFFRFLLAETRVEVFPEAMSLPDLPQLLLLGMFLKVNVEKRGRRVF